MEMNVRRLRRLPRYRLAFYVPGNSAYVIRRPRFPENQSNFSRPRPRILILSFSVLLSISISISRKGSSLKLKLTEIYIAEVSLHSRLDIAALRNRARKLNALCKARTVFRQFDPTIANQRETRGIFWAIQRKKQKGERTTTTDEGNRRKRKGADALKRIRTDEVRAFS